MTMPGRKLLGAAVTGLLPLSAALAGAANLADLSPEELSSLEITPVSRRPERLGEAAASVYVITAENSKTYDLDVNSYVVKPADFAAVIDVGRQAGYYWLAINRPS